MQSSLFTLHASNKKSFSFCSPGDDRHTMRNSWFTSQTFTAVPVKMLLENSVAFIQYKTTSRPLHPWGDALLLGQSGHKKALSWQDRWRKVRKRNKYEALIFHLHSNFGISCGKANGTQRLLLFSVLTQACIMKYSCGTYVACRNSLSLVIFCLPRYCQLSNTGNMPKKGLGW